ncbi:MULTISPECIES: ATP-binding protein [Acetobacter]|nr:MULTISPECIES: hypothetical protein [Acetobacter]
MFDFGVSNIRRLKNSESFNIKKITLLLGRNSSGKSTFLRSFPLMKQSINTRTSAPILWFGDFVDFGDFENAVADHAVNTPITFKFGVDHMPVEQVRALREFTYGITPFFVGRDIMSHAVENLKYYVDVVKFKNKTRISKITISIGLNFTYEINISEAMRVDTFFVNGVEVEDYKEYFDFIISPDSIFPIINISNRKKNDLLENSLQFSNRLEVSPLYPIFQKALKLLSENINSRISDRNKKIYTSFLLTMMPYSMENIKKSKKVFQTKAWEKFICYILSTKGQKTFQQFEKYNAIFSINIAINSIRSYFSPIMSSVLYIGPARAKSDRYYRYQYLKLTLMGLISQCFLIHYLSQILRNFLIGCRVFSVMV